MKKIPEIQIPFRDGNPLNYDYGSDDIEWKDNAEFYDTLTLYSISRGRSAANFKLIGLDGTSYTMFMKDLFDACTNGTVKKGKIKGVFCFVKRGMNYGVKWIRCLN